MNIPERFNNAKMDDSIRLEKRKSWYLWGNPGRGKTYYLYALWLEWDRKVEIIRKKENEPYLHFPGRMLINWADYSDIIRYAKFEDKSDKVNSMMQAPFLFIDDIGVEKKSEFSDTILYRVLNHRYDRNMYTAFTSNVKIGDLDYDGRIISRIIGIVGENKFELKGDDRRRKIGK